MSAAVNQGRKDGAHERAWSPQECNGRTFAQVEKSRRDYVLRRMVEGDVPILPACAKSLLHVHCKEMDWNDLDVFISAVKPFDLALDALDVTNPKLCNIKLDDFERSETFLMLVIQERLIPLVSQGQKSAELVRRLCIALLDLTEKLPSDLGIMMTACLEETREVASYFLALQSPEFGVRNTCVETLDCIRAGTKGAKALVKTAISMQAYWKDLDKKYRSTAVKALALQGEVQEVVGKLQKGELVDIRAAIDILPAWREAMRSVVVAPVEEALEQALKSQVEHIKDVAKGIKSAKAEGLDALVQLLKHADTMLRRPDEVKSKYALWAKEAEQLSSQVLEQLNLQNAKEAAEPYMQDRLCKTDRPSCHYSSVCAAVF